MNKKILIIGGVIVLILVLIGFGWFFLRSKGGGTLSNGIGGFLFPGGNTDTTPRQTTPSSNNQGDTSVSQGVNFQTEALLVKLSDAPISGFTNFNRGSSTIVRYVERATGHLYEIDTTLSQKNRISNTTIPKVENIAWGSAGNSFILRYAKDGAIQSFSATVSSSTGTTTNDGSLAELTGNYLDPNIGSFLFSPKFDQTFFTKTDSEGIKAWVANTKKTSQSLVWQFGTTEWLFSWPSDDTITATTKASNGILGYMIEINPKTKKVTSLLSGVFGLTTLTNNKTGWVLYSTASGQDMSLNIYDQRNKTTTSLISKTLPEKCVWTQKTIRIYCAIPKDTFNSKLPDDWYKGVVSFSDSLWLYDSREGWGTDQIADIESLAGEAIDVENPQINADDTLLVFMNKKDLSLWALKLDPNKQIATPGEPTATSTQP